MVEAAKVKVETPRDNADCRRSLIVIVAEVTVEEASIRGPGAETEAAKVGDRGAVGVHPGKASGRLAGTKEEAESAVARTLVRGLG